MTQTVRALQLPVSMSDPQYVGLRYIALIFMVDTFCDALISVCPLLHLFSLNHATDRE
jgi:hypothetical protein